MKIKKKSLFNIINFIIISLLALVVCLRGNTKDTYAYYSVFKNIELYDLSIGKFYYRTGMEIGYGVISYIIHFFSNNFIIFSYIFSCITFFFIKKIADILAIRFIDVLFFYIPTFFITQQLMQIRQGLASAIIFLALFLIYSKKQIIKGGILSIIACCIHSISFAFLVFFLRPVKKYIYNNSRIYLRFFLWFIVIFTACRLAISFSILTSINDRISSYAEMDSYSGMRDFFALPNIRAIVFGVFFVLICKRVDNDNYRVLLYLFITCLAIRLGFYDFEILSGRLGVAFGFSEIFLLPIALRSLLNGLWFYIAAIVYLFGHAYITLYIQVPDLIIDYFSPFYFW